MDGLIVNFWLWGLRVRLLRRKEKAHDFETELQKHNRRQGLAFEGFTGGCCQESETEGNGMVKGRKLSRCTLKLHRKVRS